MSAPQKKERNGESGQAAIEFIAIVVVVFFFLFFVMSTAILLVVSDYIDYATFMTARTYKTGSSSEDQQKKNAEIVWESYLDKVYPEIIKSRIPANFQAVDSNNVRTAGVITTYTIDLFYLPPLFTGTAMPSRITLNSEAHLGRDPSFEECEGFFVDFANGIGVGDPNLAAQMEDNGC